MLEGMSILLDMPFSVYGGFKNVHAVGGELSEGLWHEMLFLESPVRP